MPLWAWIAFNAFVLVALVVDLLVADRRAHVVRPREALAGCAVWIGLALAFNGLIWWRLGSSRALEFLTGYLIEQSLSVDNLFVFMVLLSYFAVPKELHHRVLFWGVIGAQIMRAIFIALGTAIIHRFHWVMYLFGLFLLVTGIKLAVKRDEEVHPEKNPALRLLRRFVATTPTYRGTRFFVREGGRTLATPLFLVLVVIETTDVVFAVDSIPAIFAITTDAFIVYTSNIFAVLGLRQLYFVLAGALSRFHLLNYGLAGVLSFVGIKMLIADVFQVSIAWSLLTIAALLGAAVVASVMVPPRAPQPEQAPGDDAAP